MFDWVRQSRLAGRIGSPPAASGTLNHTIFYFKRFVERIHGATEWQSRAVKTGGSEIR